MSESKLFGESIDQRVIDQIRVREETIAGTEDNGSVLSSKNRNIKDIQLFSGRTAWIRMISSVDVRTNEGFTPNLSKNFILSGGELKTSPGGIERKSGVSFQAQDPNSVYRKTNELGVRPEAGITSFSIQHKGTYGSLREATVSFNVWSREDLDKAQNIYLRPGVHMIVEWGHTVYKTGVNAPLEETILPDPSFYFTKNSR